jgi:hypothetical protein
LLILALMAFCCGVLSASTKFCANDATSTPEPALSDVSSFWAAARLAAAMSAAVLVLLLADETAVVAMVWTL